jgi:AraC-like DNA-binding protein
MRKVEQMKSSLHSPPTVAVVKSKSVMAALLASNLYRQYRRAFSDLTGFDLTLRPVGAWPLKGDSSSKANPLCQYLGNKSCTCHCCKGFEKKISLGRNSAQALPTQEFCLCGVMVPVWLGQQLVGVLQMARRPSRGADFASAARSKRGMARKLAHTPPLTGKQQGAAVKLLNIFATHLAMMCNQLALQMRTIEPAVITRAKALIETHHATDLSLAEAARTLSLNRFHFCKLFKKSTGLNFTEYVSRVRVEHARTLLLTTNLRVSEIAFQVGFQSLTTFNRVFKNAVGHCPTESRRPTKE